MACGLVTTCCSPHLVHVRSKYHLGNFDTVGPHESLRSKEPEAHFGAERLTVYIATRAGMFSKEPSTQTGLPTLVSGDLGCSDLCSAVV